MSACRELCPHCVVVPMIAFTNGFGGAFLTCMDCGYCETIQRRPDPTPDIVAKVQGSDGQWRTRVTNKREQRLAQKTPTPPSTRAA